MKLSKLLHVVSVFLGLTGIVMWTVAIFAWPDGVVRFGVTRGMMLMCAILSFLTGIWLLLGAIHHITLEKMESWFEPALTRRPMRHA